MVRRELWAERRCPGDEAEMVVRATAATGLRLQVVNTGGKVAQVNDHTFPVDVLYHLPQVLDYLLQFLADLRQDEMPWTYGLDEPAEAMYA